MNWYNFKLNSGYKFAMGVEHSKLNRIQVQSTQGTSSTTAGSLSHSQSDSSMFLVKQGFEYTTINIDIPVSLRLVHTFLSDSQKYLRSIRQVSANINEINNRKTLALLCINYAFQVSTLTYSLAKAFVNIVYCKLAPPIAECGSARDRCARMLRVA